MHDLKDKVVFITGGAGGIGGGIEFKGEDEFGVDGRGRGPRSINSPSQRPNPITEPHNGLNSEPSPEDWACPSPTRAFG